MDRRQFLIRGGQAALVFGVPTGMSTLSAFAHEEEKPKPASGPLRVSARNPRYFCDASGREVLLVGSHTWNNLVDMG
ncbi:MAG: hypothetical protein H5U08_15580, partial [Thermogutta sp.]|uniref:hypothetical protein n=1 Tax=Thermogutta sp. TaxID=1962930 RepID=UPI001985517D